jgi:hypothetical protein
MANATKHKSYFKSLMSKVGRPATLILGISLLYVAPMPFIVHDLALFPYIILALAVLKTIIISIVTLKQLSSLLSAFHTLEEIAWTFGVLIIMTTFSFATDFTCLYQSDQIAFEGLPLISNSYFHDLYHFFYFSVITFSTVGYGDITPISGAARFIVMLEIFMSFVIMIFALSNVKNISSR